MIAFAAHREIMRSHQFKVPARFRTIAKTTRVNVACPECNSPRDVYYRSRTRDFRCKMCKIAFTRETIISK